MSKYEVMKLPGVRALIKRALEEDIGAGDATTTALVEPQATAHASMLSKADCVLAGIPVAAAVFKMTATNLEITVHRPDGSHVQSGETLLTVAGPAAAILTAERTALNFVQRLSGVATLAAQMVKRIQPHPVQILDTRKTTPGMRALEKYAVHCGGGTNHRHGLYDAVLIKDNHIAFWRQHHQGTLADVVAAARRQYPALKIEIEVDTIDQLREVLPAKPDWVLLDNMAPALVKDCVALCRGICQTEASGGISSANIAEYAATGVHAISLGCLTHSAPAVDISLDFMQA